MGTEGAGEGRRREGGRFCGKAREKGCTEEEGRGEEEIFREDRQEVLMLRPLSRLRERAGVRGWGECVAAASAQRIHHSDPRDHLAVIQVFAVQGVVGLTTQLL